MNIPLVDLKAQYLSIKDEIDQAILDCIAEGIFIGGEPVREFEKDFAKFCETAYCVSCGNCTDALEIALKTLDIGEGDEVIVPAMSFIASSEAVTNAGAKVIFCDIDPDTYNINVDLIPELISSKTKAILPVHLYGQMTDMVKIRSIADQHGLKIIEDAAQAHGASFSGKPVGYYSDFAAFSFYPGKNLGAYGDAGALITNNEELAIKAKMYANHGRISKYDHVFEGRNSRMDTLQATILNVKLKYLKNWTKTRNTVAAKYNNLLRENEAVRIPVVIEGAYHVYHLYVIQTNPDWRDDLIRILNDKGIGVGKHYPIALPFLKAYENANLDERRFRACKIHSERLISLPIFPEISNQQIEHIITILINACHGIG